MVTRAGAGRRRVAPPASSRAPPVTPRGDRRNIPAVIRFALLVALGAACSSSSTSPSSGTGSTSQPQPGVAAGAEAPDVALRDQTDATWRIADGLSRHARVMLVFYRGDW